MKPTQQLAAAGGIVAAVALMFGIAPAGATGDDDAPPEQECHPSYEGVCVPVEVEDVDCEGGDGNGPEFVAGPVIVVGDDEYGLDADGDGVACEPPDSGTTTTTTTTAPPPNPDPPEAEPAPAVVADPTYTG